MATAFFGDGVTATTGDWNTAGNWYSSQGGYSSSFFPGIHLGRVPTLADTITIVDKVTTGPSGGWTGPFTINGKRFVGSLPYPHALGEVAAGTYTGNVTMLTLATGLGTFAQATISGGTFGAVISSNGTQGNHIISAGTFTGSFTVGTVGNKFNISGGTFTPAGPIAFTYSQGTGKWVASSWVSDPGFAFAGGTFNFSSILLTGLPDILGAGLL